MKFSFKKRIAIFNTLAVALTTAIVFIIIYAVVHSSSYRHLDSDIQIEKEAIFKRLNWKEDSIIIVKMPEWEKSEHRKVEVNPTFIQIVDNKDRLIFKSSNLRANHFLFKPVNENGYFYNTHIEKQRLRLGQFPVKNADGKTIGQITIGISQQESYYVLNNLLITLCISFPILLLILYLVIYLSASKAIAPVNQLIRAASGINDSNINTRLPLPENEDELHQLASTINELLERIDSSVQQQKQFTADASHEIRTPLAAIRGTLEVLIRKKREPAQYEEKINEVIAQTDRLNQLLDQLLQLARLEGSSAKKELILFKEVVLEAISKCEKKIVEKGIKFKISIPEDTAVYADNFFLSVIINNLVNNAVKYGDDKAEIAIAWLANENTLSITNSAPPISAEQIPFLFNRFYRIDDSRSSHIPGSGLGLAIVKKLADLQHIKIYASSSGKNISFSLKFPQ